MHIACARNLRSTSVWASYKHHDTVVCFMVAPRRGLQFVAPDALKHAGELLDCRRRNAVLSARCKTSETEKQLRRTSVTIRPLVLDEPGLGWLADHAVAKTPQTIRLRGTRFDMFHLTADPAT